MEFDILQAIQEIHTPILDRVMLYITKLGDHGMIWIVTGICLLCSKKYRKCGVVVLLSLLASLILGNGILKNLIKRDRPCWIHPDIALLIKNPRDYSFPSGHTFSSFAAAISIFYYEKRFGSACLALATLIGFSRLYLYVHFPTDVAAGAIFGTATAFTIANFIEWMEKKKKSA